MRLARTYWPAAHAKPSGLPLPITCSSLQRLGLTDAANIKHCSEVTALKCSNLKRNAHQKTVLHGQVFKAACSASHGDQTFNFGKLSLPFVLSAYGGSFLIRACSVTLADVGAYHLSPGRL